MERKKIIIYALAVLAALTVIFLPGFSELQKLREQNAQLIKRIELLEENNEILKEEIARMKQEPDYVEGRAREKLGIIRKGEIIYKPGEAR